MRVVGLSIYFQHRTCDLFERLTWHITPIVMKTGNTVRHEVVCKISSVVCYGVLIYLWPEVRQTVSGRLQESPHNFRSKIECTALWFGNPCYVTEREREREREN
jgi:hypothetical protein